MGKHQDSNKHSKRPPDTGLRQQRLVSYKPLLDPTWTITFLFVLAIVFIPTGFYIQNLSDSLTELSFVYDSGKNDGSSICSINRANQNKSCLVTLTATEDMEPPILVYYKITNFFQNHRTYFRSVDFRQLQGQLPLDQTTLAAKNCAPLNQLGNITLNPCGLRANTFFNDVIRLESKHFLMREDGIAYLSDLEYKFQQPIGFRSEECASCEGCSCDGDDWSCKEPYEDEEGKCHRYFYPDDDKTQYLHETYPMVVNPLEGVTNEHFVVWMRIAILKNFRKLYGWIEEPIAKGTKLQFRILANWDVSSFRGSKTLVVTTNNSLGGKNDFLGPTFTITGYCCLGLGILFGLKQFFSPRRLADRMYLEFKED